MHVPPEAWKLIAEFVEPNLWTYICLSRISVASRAVFLSDAVWRRLDPYGWNSEISMKFYEMWSKFSPVEKQRIKLAWTEPAEALIFRMSKGQFPPLFNERLRSKGIKCGSDRWFELGYILSTAKFTVDSGLRIQKSDQAGLLMAAIKIDSRTTNRIDSTCQDWELVMEAVSRQGSYLEFVDPQMPDFHKICIAAAQTGDEQALEFVPKQLWAVKSVAMRIAGYCASTPHWVQDLYNLPDYKQIVLQSLRAPEGWSGYRLLPYYLQTDPDIVMAVFKNMPRTLPQFGVLVVALHDHELVQRVIAIDGSALAYAPAHFRADKSLVSKALDTCAMAIVHASFDLQANRALAQKAVAQDGRAFTHLSYELQQDVALARLAVASDGSAIELMPQHHNQMDLVLTALGSSPRSLKELGSELQANAQVVETAVRGDGLCLEWASTTLQKDPIIVAKAIRQNPCSLRFADPGLQDDHAIVLEAVKYNGLALEWASPRLRNNKEIVLAAVGSDANAWEFAPSFNNDRQVVLAVLDQIPINQHQVRPFAEDREVVMAAVKQDGSLLAVCSKFCSDQEVVQAAVLNDGTALIYASTALQRHSDFELMAAIGKGRHPGWPDYLQPDYLQRFIP